MPNRRVMIVDDDPALVQALSARMKSCGIEVWPAADGRSAMAAIGRCNPDLIVLDVNMPGGDGLSLCEALARDTSLVPRPVIMLTGRTDRETIMRCEELGAHYVRKTPDVWGQLRPLLGQLLELPELLVEGEATPTARAEPGGTVPRVLVIDDDPDISKALKIKLKAYGVEVIRAFSGMQGYWAALKERPDAIICDYKMPEGCGNYVLGKLKDHSLTKDIPVVFLTGRTIAGRRDHALERDLLSLGAVGFLTKPLDFEALLSTLRAHMDIPARPSMPMRACLASAG